MRLHLYAKLTEIQSRNRRQIDNFLYNAPNRYKVYSIPKRNGGERVIAQPSGELKNFQHHLINILESNFLTHSSAVAYKKGFGIKHNAAMHSSNPYLLKLDFTDFFNSITPELFFMACTWNGYELSTAEKRVFTKGLFWNKAKSQLGRLSLSVGAPSSPLISNIIMYLFDEEFSRRCEQRGIVYTRYADDITFSTHHKNSLFSLPDEVRVFLNKNYHNRITLNERKTIFTSRAHNRHVTGVTLTTQGGLSVGRDRKRFISSLIHKYTLGILEPEMAYYLQGLLSFAIYIEPEFRTRMSKKYSQETILELLKLRKEDGIENE
ncbi:retron St85 family RNA-directed DNA polymerase [Serratia proteamaculans]|uniref:retron St85 family RNA-directed DNA polymerase n=1 Tax=Serratia proteamaculans TaxID=28151 RepID=UPI00217C8EA9|nr:retron St85 family RNA-directed DNA polymerase [Serratia proteamaculans]CAI0904650.1 Retron-type reverse transcriptase [Serratia proteamaculans]CAI0965728.1 Retron-type reverse transcriptase [Serratia proteamaculans]